MSLYKTSDGSGEANLSVLGSLIDQHGQNSEEVRAFIESYAKDREQSHRIADFMLRRFMENTPK